MNLNDRQRAAAEHDGRHILVYAGAGTGKTRTIIARVAHLIKTGVPPGRILLLTFTRRAAREMMDRLEDLVGRECNRILAGTFHYFCLYTMKRMPAWFGVDRSVVIDRDDQLQLMSAIRKEVREDKSEKPPRASELVNLYSYARNTVRPFGEYLDRYTDFRDADADKIKKIFDEYEKRKASNDYLDFDDILFRFVEELHARPEARDRIRGFYDHILVDEMQDTNPLQWRILEGMRDPARLFCVGDDAQSIYAFRGADFRNVRAFTERTPDAVALQLDENYRSAQGVLDLSNWLLRQSPLGYNKNLTAHRRAESIPKIVDFSGDIEEGAWVAEDMMNRRKKGEKWKDFMIISRTAYAARTVESFLVEGGVPYRFIGGLGLMQSAHVKDIFSLVRASLNHRDEIAWTRFLMLWPRIGAATAAKYCRILKQEEAMEKALAALDAALKKRRDILDGVRRIQAYRDDPAVAVQEASSLLLPFLSNRYEDWRKRQRDVELIARLAARFASLSEFLTAYTLDPVSATDARQMDLDDIVTITTAHSAKGTEARVCYLIRVDPHMYPHRKSVESGNAEDIEEERRILYVAMTRAMDELIITRITQRGQSFGYGRHAGGFYGFQEVPYFLDCLDQDLVEMVRPVRKNPRYSR